MKRNHAFRTQKKITLNVKFYSWLNYSSNMMNIIFRRNRCSNVREVYFAMHFLKNDL